MSVMGNDEVLLVKIVCLDEQGSLNYEIRRNITNELRSHLIDLFEEFLFDIEILDDRFDDQVALFDSLVHIGTGLDSTLNLAEILFSALLIFLEFLLHHTFQTGLNDVQTFVEKFLFLIDKNDMMVGLRCDLHETFEILRLSSMKDLLERFLNPSDLHRSRWQF